jgi:hypothetical protein
VDISRHAKVRLRLIAAFASDILRASTIDLFSAGLIFCFGPLLWESRLYFCAPQVDYLLPGVLF